MQGTSVLSPASPLLLLVIPAWVIAYKSDQNIFHAQPILYVLVFGLVAAKITNRLVVAHMCKGEISHRDAAMLAPLLLLAVTARLGAGLSCFCGTQPCQATRLTTASTRITKLFCLALYLTAM